MSIVQIYHKELKRLYYFGCSLLPILSLLSIGSGQFFLREKIVSASIIHFPEFMSLILAILLVSINELAKYFLTPLVPKSLWHKHVTVSISVIPIALLFYGISVYLSVQGFQAFYKKADTTELVLLEAFTSSRDSIVRKYDSMLARKDSNIQALGASIENQEVLTRLDRINRQLRSVERDSTSRAKNRLQSLERDKRLLEFSTLGGKLTLNRITQLQEERKALLVGKADMLEKLEVEKETQLALATSSSSFIQKNFLVISLMNEFLILLALGFGQYYRLMIRDRESTVEKDGTNEGESESVSKGVHSKNGTKHKVSKAVRITDQQREEIFEKLRKAENPSALVGEIVEEYGVAKRTVYRYIKKIDLI
ncbi:MAG: hypothetical protein AAGC85_15890 [Bacteroidota bacterium]